jgi:hypothetical protein
VGFGLLPYHSRTTWIIAFHVLICLNCLFTKQHYLIDLPAGALLSWIDYGLDMKLVAGCWVGPRS